MTRILNVVRALYSYEPEVGQDQDHDQELAFKEDELLLILENSAQDWWYAERLLVSEWEKKESDAGLEWEDQDQGNSHRGWIPSNYVQDAECQFVAPAIYDFDPSQDDAEDPDPDQIILQSGKQVLVYDVLSDPNWWLVKNTQGEYGWVPANYLGVCSNDQLQKELMPQPEDIFSELATRSIQLMSSSIDNAPDEGLKIADEAAVPIPDPNEEKKRKQEEKQKREQEERDKKEQEKQEEKERKEKEKSQKEQEKEKREQEERERKEKEKEKKEQEKAEKENEKARKKAEKEKIPSPPSITVAAPTLVVPQQKEPQIAPPVQKREEIKIMAQPPPVAPRKAIVKEPEPTIKKLDDLPTLPKKKQGILEDWKASSNPTAPSTSKLPELPPRPDATMPKEQSSQTKLAAEAANVASITPKKALPERPSRPPEPPTASASKAEAQKPDPSSARIWCDKTGSFSVEATFVSVNQDAEKVTVVLCKLNGSKVSIGLDKLSDSDVAFVRSKMRDMVGIKDDSERKSSAAKQDSDPVKQLVEAINQTQILEPKKTKQELQAPLQPQQTERQSANTANQYSGTTMSSIQEFLQRNSQQKQEQQALVNAEKRMQLQQAAQQQNNSAMLQVQSIRQEQQLRNQQMQLLKQQQENEILQRKVAEMRARQEYQRQQDQMRLEQARLEEQRRIQEQQLLAQMRLEEQRKMQEQQMLAQMRLEEQRRIQEQQIIAQRRLQEQQEQEKVRLKEKQRLEKERLEKEKLRLQLLEEQQREEMKLEQVRQIQQHQQQQQILTQQQQQRQMPAQPQYQQQHVHIQQQHFAMQSTMQPYPMGQVPVPVQPQFASQPQYGMPMAATATLTQQHMQQHSQMPQMPQGMMGPNPMQGSMNPGFPMQVPLQNQYPPYPQNLPYRPR